ncbi:hypothetical protein C8F01DRAFT_1231799 [Mycena amicta]|nr:hypothetical protein C8F01DRAFT_1231799 [Mycena amicta]
MPEPHGGRHFSGRRAGRWTFGEVFPRMSKHQSETILADGFRAGVTLRDTHHSRFRPPRPSSTPSSAQQRLGTSSSTHPRSSPYDLAPFKRRNGSGFTAPSTPFSPPPLSSRLFLKLYHFTAALPYMGRPQRRHSACFQSFSCLHFSLVRHHLTLKASNTTSIQPHLVLCPPRLPHCSALPRSALRALSHSPLTQCELRKPCQHIL